MRAGVVQFHPRFGDIAGNLERMTAMLEPEDAGILVLPELALSGYIFESRDEAISMSQAPSASEFDGG